MKKNELKKVLKPLIKECIKEVIFEDGILSGLISEVLKGTSGAPLVSESVQKKPESPKMFMNAGKRRAAKQENLKEVRRSLTEAIGKSAYGGVDLFEGVEPISKAGAPSTSASPQSPLHNVPPSDSGVDISAIFNPNWKNMV